MGLVPTAARPPLRWCLLHGKPPSAARFSLILARLERASLTCCLIGDCREAVPTDGASEPPTRGAGRRTCSEHWGSHFGARGYPPAAQVSCCWQRRRQLRDVRRSYWPAPRRTCSIIGSAASGTPLTRGAAKKMKTPAKTGASIAFNREKDGECTFLKKHLHCNDV